MKIFGFIPVRLDASRFPRKPFAPILGRPMIEHCYERASLYDGWDGLWIATCDDELFLYSQGRRYPVLMTSADHTRALDRVAEAVTVCGEKIQDDDIVICVQGDEPMLGPDIISIITEPFYQDIHIAGTMLAVPIVDEETYLNTDTVKLVHNIAGDVLYTSRSPIPYAESFSPGMGAKRVGGIFGFRWKFLKWFKNEVESPLEIAESCDSNRIYDHGFTQRIVLMPSRSYQSVDSPEDIARVEAVMKMDPYWGSY